MFAFPPRRILVPVDLSAASAAAYKSALLLAARFDARVEAVYCEAPPPPETGLFVPAAAWLPRRSKLEAALKRVCPKADARHVVTGDPRFVLPKLVARRRPDLVVMGTHGLRGLERAILGSVTESMLRRSAAPVLSLRRALRRPRRVLAPVRDGGGAYGGLLAAALMAQAFGARLDVLHVVAKGESPIGARMRMRTLLLDLPKDVLEDVKPRVETRAGGTIEQILRAARGRDLIVLVARRKSLLGDLILGTTAERVARYARVPVLAVPSAPARRATLI